VVVFLALVVVLLVVPRSVDPIEIPPPGIDPRALAQTFARDDARARAAVREPLDADVRTLGSAVHAYGRADYDGGEEALLKARARVVEAVVPALTLGEEPVLRLRAYQQSIFLREVRRWETTGVVSDALAELGGGFPRLVERNGWVRAVRGGVRLVMDEAALRAMFKKRWNEITSLRGELFELTLDEQRALTRFLLGHPTSFGNGPAPGEPETPGWRVARETHEDQFRLKKIDELAAIDPSYPRELARGIVLFHMQRYALAAKAFNNHLETSPDGPYALRAQNYLRASLGHALDER
jgi:hypothetical protein